MPHCVIISLASNHQQTENLLQARQRLGQVLLVQRFTEAIWTEPFHAHGPEKYLNQLLHATTELAADELVAALKQIEREMGRTPEDRQAGVVRIDLDLLQYDQQRYHLRDWERDYVQRLL